MAHRFGTVSARMHTATMTCAIAACSGPIKRKGLCYAHYMRAWRYGDPLHQPSGRPAADLTGRRFGSLTAVSRIGTRAGLWECRCDCGNLTHVRVGDLNRGAITTCGERPTHPRKAVIGYAGAHDRVEAARGRAAQNTCVDCGRQAEHWSYDHADPDELTEYAEPYWLPYSLSPEHYQPRCVRCHRAFDRTVG